jgi:hypothetical protein
LDRLVDATDRQALVRPAEVLARFPARDGIADGAVLRARIAYKALDRLAARAQASSAMVKAYRAGDH